MINEFYNLSFQRILKNYLVNFDYLAIELFILYPIDLFIY